MKMDQILQMKGGMGDESYANNSKVQSDRLSKSTATVEQAAIDLCSSINLPRHVAIADLGCSSGPNSLAAVAKITSTIYKWCCQKGRPPPELTVFLNDLPSNDFNAVFASLPAFHQRMQQECGPDFGPCYTAGVPGSFYGRLFPPKSLHFVHSSSSVHWLSQVPPELRDKVRPLINKGKIFISKSSPREVIKAYSDQFQRDFSSFLRCRSEEIAPDGRMVLIFSGRMTLDPTVDESCLLWDYMGQAFQELVLEGMVEEEKLDSYNTPYYEPCMEEIRDEIERHGSFIMDRVGTIPISWDTVTGGKTSDRTATAQQMAKAIRAVNESMIRNHFGGQILDGLFQRFTKIMAQDTKVVGHVSMLLSLIRKN